MVLGGSGGICWSRLIGAGGKEHTAGAGSDRCSNHSHDSQRGPTHERPAGMNDQERLIRALEVLERIVGNGYVSDDDFWEAQIILGQTNECKASETTTAYNFPTGDAEWAEAVGRSIISGYDTVPGDNGSQEHGAQEPDTLGENKDR